jgi:hypothetical protein
MKRFLSMVGVLTMVVAAATTIAQSKPNFAGKWTLVPDPNAAAGGGGRGGRGGGLGNEFTAAQDDKTLTVTSTTQMGTTKSVYNLDGSETKNPITFNDQTIERVSKVKWDGAKLVITTTTNFQGTPRESTQTWALDASGNLIVESTSNFTGTPTTTKTTYKKS